MWAPDSRPSRCASCGRAQETPNRFAAVQESTDRQRAPRRHLGASRNSWREVEFTEWTSDGRLRHPSFQGLREDKPPKQVVREIEKSTTALERAASNGSVNGKMNTKKSAAKKKSRGSRNSNRRQYRANAKNGVVIAGVRLYQPGPRAISGARHHQATTGRVLRTHRRLDSAVRRRAAAHAGALPRRLHGRVLLPEASHGLAARRRARRHGTR